MCTSPYPDQTSLADYTRPLPPLIGMLLLIALGTGLIFRLRGLGFLHGFLGFSATAVLMMMLIGSFAFAGMLLDRRLGYEVTFRLLGAAIGFVVLGIVLYHLSPLILSPQVAEELLL